jgi:VanZ family protein
VKKNIKNKRLVSFILNRRLHIILFAVWFFVIMILSVIPDYTPNYITYNRHEFRIDYFKHFLVFLPLGFMLMCVRRMGILLLFILSVIVVSVPEGVQYFIPYRTFNPMDLASSCVGFIFGIFMKVFFVRKFVVSGA